MIRRPFFALMMSAVAFTAVMADVPLDQCSQIEQAEKSPLSPFDGMILLKSNILKNMRLYGLYASDENEIKKDLPPHAAFVKAGKPEFLKNNVPVEPIGALAQYLFPSMDGAILTHNERTGDFWGFIARSQKVEKKGVALINDLLTKLIGSEGPLSQKVLKGEEKLDEEKLEKVVNDWVNEVNEKATVKKSLEDQNQGLGNVKTVLLEALKTTVSPFDKKGEPVYAPHVALHLLVAFAFRISDSAEEFSQLKAVVELDRKAPLFSQEAYTKGVEPLKDKFQSKDLVHISPKEIFLFAQGYETYAAVVPSLVPYQNTTYTPPSSGKQQRAPISYPDCGETSLLNFFRIVLGKDGQFSSDYVEALEKKLQLSETKETHAHKAFLAFFRENPDFQQALTEKGHAAWSQVVSNLNHESRDSGNQVDYLKGKSTCEMNAGVINMLSVIEKLIPHPEFKTTWTEKPEILKKALNDKETLTEDEKGELELALKKAARKLTLLCELFSRDGFQLDWSCKDQRTLPAITGIDVSFTVNGAKAFAWKFMSGHFEIKNDLGANNNWQNKVSFDNSCLRDHPLLQSLLVKAPDILLVHLHPFHEWGLNASDIELAEYVVRKNLDRAQKNPTRNRPLLHKVNVILDKVFPEGDREAQRKLLEFSKFISNDLIGEVPSLKRMQQGTLLLKAASDGDGELAKKLLEQKAPVDFRDEQGKTPLHLAISNNGAEIVKLLIDKKASVNAETYTQGTPLHIAAQKGSKDVVALLLGKGASVNATNFHGRTPLYEAIMRSKGSDDELLVKLLLKGGSSLDATDTFGMTPLHVAAGNGSKEVVKLLLKEGASLDAKDNRNRTPFDVAQKLSGRQEIAQLLEEHRKNQENQSDGHKKDL